MTVSPGQLDHLGVAVRSLAQAREIYSNLGFTLTPLSAHSGQGPDGKIQAFGSGNHCAMFEFGYLELIGVVDPARPSSVAPFLANRQGGFITAIAAGTAEEAYEAASVFPSAKPPVLLQRTVTNDAGEPEVAQFRNVLLGDAFPESRVLMIQHLSRESLWRQEYMTHANGVTGLIGVEYLVNDPQEAANRYARLTGGRILSGYQDGSYRLALPGQELRFRPLSGSVSDKGGITAVPHLSGGIFRVKSIAATASYLDARTVSFKTTSEEHLTVSPDQACGFTLTFTSAGYQE